MRRGVLPLLLLLPAVVVAAWLATRTGEDGGSGGEVGREAADEGPPMLKGTGEAQAAGAEPSAEPDSRSPGATSPTVPTATKEHIGSEGEPLEGVATLVVRVRDPQGRPRAGVRIRLYVPIAGTWKFTHDVRLDATGEVRFDDAYPSRVYVWIDDEHSHRSRHVQLDRSQPTEVDLVIPFGGTITGTLRHLEKGVLGAVRVVIEIKEQDFRATYRTQTDAEGRFRLEGVSPGTHGIGLVGGTIGYYQRPRAQVVVRDGETVHKDIVLGQVSLIGRVRDVATGKPLPEVRVGLAKVYVPTTTDAFGMFRVLDLPPGSYYLAFSRDGYLKGSLKDVTVSEGAITEVEIDLQPAGLIVLRLRTPEGKAVTGTVQLQFSPVEGQGTYGSVEPRTDGFGVVRCEQVLPGTYMLRTKVEGYEVEPVQVDLGHSETPIDVVCRPVVRTGVPLLQGVVHDARTREPIPGVSIRPRQGWEDPAITNEEGRYALWWRGEGTQDLIVSRDGYGIRFLRGVRLKQGVETVLDIELTPATVAHLWLTDAGGQAVVGSVTLVVSPKEKDAGLTSLGTGVRSDAEGHAVYRQIVPGDYKLIVIDEKAGRGEVEAVIRPGENTVRIQLTP